METLQAACNMLAAVFKEVCMDIMWTPYNTSRIAAFLLTYGSGATKRFCSKHSFANPLRFLNNWAGFRYPVLLACLANQLSTRRTASLSV